MPLPLARHDRGNRAREHVADTVSCPPVVPRPGSAAGPGYRTAGRSGPRTCAGARSAPDPTARRSGSARRCRPGRAVRPRCRRRAFIAGNVIAAPETEPKTALAHEPSIPSPRGGVAFSDAPQRQHRGVRIPGGHRSGAAVCDQVESLEHDLADEHLAVARFDDARGEGRGQRPEPDQAPVSSRVGEGCERRRAFSAAGPRTCSSILAKSLPPWCVMRARRRSTYSHCSFDGCFGSPLDRLGVVDAVAKASHRRSGSDRG